MNCQPMTPVKYLFFRVFRVFRGQINGKRAQARTRGSLISPELFPGLPGLSPEPPGTFPGYPGSFPGVPGLLPGHPGLFPGLAESLETYVNPDH